MLVEDGKVKVDLNKTDLMLEYINLSIQQTNILLLELLRRKGNLTQEAIETTEEVLAEQERLNNLLQENKNENT